MFLYYYVFKNFPSRKQNFIRTLALGQGLYFFITGIWPILDMGTFMAVTGPKTDIWLVKLVGLLTVSISLLLLIVAKRNHMTTESLVLIMVSGISYLTIDLYYSLTGVISFIYLADAALQIIFLVLWAQWLVKIRFRLKNL
jgi:hypothetical protein